MKKYILGVVTILSIACLVSGVSLIGQVSATVPGTNYLASKDSSGTYANAQSSGPIISGDGRYVAFNSFASNLVPGDVNGVRDVFVRDTLNNTTTRASLHWGDNAELTAASTLKSMSYDGRYVVFTYTATGLLAVRDTTTSTTQVVCPVISGCSSYGMRGGAISSDGKYVTYTTQPYAGYKFQAVVTNMQTNVQTLLSADATGNPGNDNSDPGGISCDGGVITFYTASTNLPSGSGGYIVTFDLDGTLHLKWVSSITNTSSVSCDGNKILNPDSTHIKVYDRLANTSTTIASVSLGNTLNVTNMSDGGRYIAYATNSNPSTTPTYSSTGTGAYADIYIYDTKTNTRQLITFTTTSIRSGMGASGVSLSGDGSKVTYDYYTPAATDTTHQLISGVTTGAATTQSDIYTSLTGY